MVRRRQPLLVQREHQQRHYPAGFPAADNSLWPWPEDFSKDYNSGALTCSYNYPGGHTFNQNNYVFTSGVYCTNGVFVLSGSHMTGTATFIASGFQLTGQGLQLNPYYKDLSLYQTGTSRLNVKANNWVNGTIFAPNAEVLVDGNGNGGTNQGFIEANQVSLGGNNYTLTGTGPSIYGSTAMLVQ